MIKGIDVSTWQGNIDFNKVKASGIDFVIIRAGYGKLTSQKDNCFEQNYKNAKAAGLDIGVYWYSYADSVASAKQEAKACIQVISGKKFEYPIYSDIEEQSQFVKGREFCSNIVTAFCNEIENAGYYAGFYISRSPLQTHITDEVAKRYALWIAEYNSKCNYSGNYGIWQYSSNGIVNGINGNVDMNYCYTNYPSIIKSGGYNGYSKNVTATSASAIKKTVEQLAREVLEGKWSTGNERKEKLTAAGYDYNAVQKKVNELCVRKSVDEIAREVIQGKWGNGDERKQKLSAAGYDYNTVQTKVNEILRG